MYSEIDRRKCASPSGTIRFRHSVRIDSANRSANAFRLGAAGWQPDDLNAAPSYLRTERFRVQRVAVEDQVALAE
jgi:hypothetical protein